MSFTIKKATRQGVKPLIGLYSESGCGKTYSSLLLARGFVGPSGKIVVCDTESGRGSLYSDVLPGGYDVLELREPFSPGRYIEAITAVEESGAQIGVIDSASHEWEGLGGVLDMAGENEARSGKAGLHNWRTPKMEHARFMLRMLQSSIPWIVCLRAKYKTKQIKNAQGRTEIVKDDFTTPIQADDFIFEMTCHGEILHDHSLRLTKCSHPSLRDCLPKDSPITSSHGEALAKWCASAGGAARPAGKAGGSEADGLKRELWTLTKSIHRENKTKLAEFLLDNGHMTPDETMDALTAPRLRDIITKLKEPADVPTP
jgi:hypothetical protein